MIVTQQTINTIANDFFRKSNFYKGQFIQLQSCKYMTLSQAVTFIAFTNECLESEPVLKDKLYSMITMALNNIPKSNASDLVNYSKNRKFDFFERTFDDKFGKKVFGIDIYKEYRKEFGDQSAKQFYTDVRVWAAEFGYYLNFVNVLRRRKIIVAKA